jgi:hypothetical protein
MEKNLSVDLKGSRPLRLSPRYTEQHWKDAFDGCEDWDAAINIVEDRIKGRWLDAAECLLDEPHSGFAIIALDCIVLESLWGFMNGKAVPHGKEQQVYQEILTGKAFGLSAELSEKLRDWCEMASCTTRKPETAGSSRRRFLGIRLLTKIRMVITCSTGRSSTAR